MAIVFDWYENPNASSEEEAALHPRIFMNGKVDTDTLCYKIHDYSSLTVGDVKNVLDNLSKILGESLREGKEVHIEGIGYFYPTLAATGKVTRSTPHKTNKVAFKTVRFRPDSNLKGHFVGVRANQSKYVRHSEKVSEVEIDMLLKEYFAEHQMMTRRDFQEVWVWHVMAIPKRIWYVFLAGRRKAGEYRLRNQPMYACSRLLWRIQMWHILHGSDCEGCERGIFTNESRKKTDKLRLISM